MAIAGKVAIVPKGEWSQDITYDKLDLVTYNGNTFIAYKPSVGVEPVNGETWMLIMEGVSVDDISQLFEDVENIINGTTTVGKATKATDADTVDGLHASAFLRKVYENKQEIDLFAIAEDTTLCPNMCATRFRAFNPTNAPVASGDFFIEVQKIDNSWIKIIATTVRSNYEYTNVKSGGVWKGWKCGAFADEVLPLTGGKLSNTLSLMEYLNVYAASSNAETYSSFIQNANGTHVRHVTDANNFDEFFIKKGSITYAKMVDGAWSQNDVLHTGNKPEGTYTGNGSTTARTIATGGIGNVIFLKSASSNLGFFSRNGGVMYNLQSKTFEYFYEDKMYFRDGNLYIATDSSLVNYNGSIFTYYVV